MFNLLLSRPKDEVALIYNKKTYLVNDILNKANEICAKLSIFEDHLNPRILVPTDNPVLFLSALIACWQKRYIVIPKRQEIDVSPLNTYEKYFPNGTIELIEDEQYKIILHKDTPKNHPYYGDIFLTTTGSTGEPKGVVLTSEQLLLNAFLAGQTIGLKKGEPWGIETDLALTSGLCHLLMAWVKGLPLYYLRNATRDEKNRFFALKNAGYGGAPIQAFRLVDEIENGFSPNHLMVSGDFLTQNMLAKIQNRFPETKIHKVYGLTEVSGRFCIMPNHLINIEQDAVGIPMPGFSVEIRNESGEVCQNNEQGLIYISSPLLMRGYLIDSIFYPQKYEEWFCTNDVGHFNDHSFLCLQGRANDSFKVGGEKVDRFTIEKALEPILSGYEYCVLPVTHNFLGYCPGLFIARNNALPKLRWKLIISQLSKYLPSRCLPMHATLLDELYRKPNGKLDRERIIAADGETLEW
ncbi:TPA: AMP-binding protein [Legionella pneumophila]|nr:acyl--CoA ligase [Legionella pneumophila]